jgi:hypothetical protein
MKVDEEEEGRRRGRELEERVRCNDGNTKRGYDDEGRETARRKRKVKEMGGETTMTRNNAVQRRGNNAKERRDEEEDNDGQG